MFFFFLVTGYSSRGFRNIRVARQISWGTSDSALSPNVIFGLCGSRSLMFPWQRSYDSEEHAAFHRASTNRTSHQPFNRENTKRQTVKSVAVFRTKIFKHRDVRQMQQNNCVKRVERRQRVNGRSATEDWKINGDHK